MKVKLDYAGGDWVEELPSILWAYRTTPRKSTGLTPFHLVYDNEAVVPIEVGVSSVRRMLYDEGNVEQRLSKLDFISEIRDRTTARLSAYRQRMRQNYDRRGEIRIDEPGERKHFAVLEQQQNAHEGLCKKSPGKLD
ncbi:uncharacterized protein LOC122014119 [Zingiber officinale]|uniref:uncharacterized protein LOC122014119 n=1 Tax=Zingiber officinale TaxID=94328 RepID=UPI001C4D2C0D|nr:uncharacterized protein LOC122014119 [Zingiber officinale]